MLLAMMLGTTSVVMADDTYLDTFAPAVYSNNQGTLSFSADWSEAGDDGDPSAGTIRIDSDELLFEAIKSKEGVSRTLDLSLASGKKVILSFDYIPNSTSSDKLTLSLYDGNSDVAIADFSGSTADTYTYELDPIYIRSDAKISFTNESQYPWDSISSIRIDNVRFLVTEDTDGDGVDDSDDIDDDNDGILDSVEIQGRTPCPHGFFQVLDGELNILDVPTATYIPIGTDQVEYNALAYNKTDGKLYGVMKLDDSANNLLKNDIVTIDRYTGELTKVFSADDPNDPGQNVFAGDIYNNVFYFKYGTETLKIYDIETGIISSLPLVDANGDPVTVKVGDLSVKENSSDGRKYAYGSVDPNKGSGSDQTLYRIDLATGEVTTAAYIMPGGTSYNTGSNFFANGDVLYINNNGSGGGTYRINNYEAMSSVTATLVSNTPGAAKNDGASCADANQDPVDTDGDGIPDYKDLDSDNDGIPDNVEAQSTSGYKAPSGSGSNMIDADGDGLDDNYDSNTSGVNNSQGLLPPDRDGDEIADFIDNDSDNDGYTDCEEGQPQPTCPVNAVNVGSNGLVDWADTANDDYTSPAGTVTKPSDDLQNETGDTAEIAYREFLCGKGLTMLTAYQWKLISIPCDTGNNEVQDIFSGLGTYDTNYVLYKQTGDDNYEVNGTVGSSHKNTNKTKLDPNATLEQGISYWIVTDQDRNVTIDVSKGGFSPTPITSASNLAGINDPDFDETYLRYLPNNDMNNPGWVKKFMAGNPFPYAFDIKKLYFSHDPAGGNDYKPMGDSTYDPYINPTFYKHDSADTSDKNVTNGGGYEAVNAGTPGFDNGGIKAMEGFFLKLPEVSGDTADNYFAYPLIMKNGSGN